MWYNPISEGKEKVKMVAAIPIYDLFLSREQFLKERERQEGL